MTEDEQVTHTLLLNAELRIIKNRLEDSRKTLVAFKMEEAARHVQEAEIYIEEKIKEVLSTVSWRSK